MPFIGKNPTAGFATIVKDDFTADGTTTVFTLSKIATVNDIAVYVGNVRQEPTDAYTVNGTTLTMSAAPATGVNFYVLHIAGTIESSVVPPDGSIGTAKLVNNAVTSAKIAAGQVTSAKLDTNIDVAGDLTVDTNTFYVDSTNNSVGIGTSTDTAFSDLHIKTSLGSSPTNASASGAIRLTSNATAGVGVGPSIMFRGQTGNSTAEYSFGSIQGVKSSSGSNDYSGDLVFYTQNSGGASAHSERLRILSAGGITFNGDTAAANALDDYEEGAHAVTFTNVAFNPASQGSVYTKIGNVVNYVGSITFPSSSDTNDINISLPFNSASNNSIGVFLSNGATNKILFTGGGGTNYMRIYPDNSFGQNNYANLSGITIYFTITYQTTT